MIALKFYTNDAQRLRPVLVRGLNDPSPHVQLRAADALHAIDPKAFIFTSSIKEATGGILKQKARH